MVAQKTTYHWLMVGACFLLMAVSIGILVNVFSPLAPRLVEYFGANDSSVQLVFMIAVLANLIGGAIAGRLMAKISMQKLMPIYAVIMSVGILGWSQFWTQTPSLGIMYLFSVLAGIGASGVSIVPCGILINNWFQEKKGVATGIAFTGSVAGGLLFVELTKYLLVNDFITAAGWQQVYLVLGIFAAVVSIFVTIFIVRGTPRDKGLLPYGAGQESVNTAATAMQEAMGIKLGKFIKTGSFWLLAISGFLIGFSNLGVQNNISLYLEGAGFNANVAATAFQIGLIVQIFAKFVLGWIYDKKGILFGQLYCLVAFIGCIVLFIFAGGSSNVVLPYAFGAVFGLVSSMTTVTPPYLTARIVGTRDYATIFGIISLFYGLGVAMGPIVVSGLSGSLGWTPVWIGLAVLMTIMTALSVFSYLKGLGFDSETD
jgi:MFS family permease